MKGLMSRGAPRRGRALLAGLLRCRRCGRRLHVTYSGANGQVPRYGCCRGAAINHGAGSCISFGGLAADRAVEEAVLAVIQPGAMEAAITAVGHAGADRKQENDVLALKLEQARYEAARARRQYDAVEPENRLVAAELEQRWNRALKAVAEVERERVAFEAGESRKDEKIDRTALLQLAEDLPRVWHDPESGMRSRNASSVPSSKRSWSMWTKNRPASTWSFAGRAGSTLDSRSGRSARGSTATRRTARWWRS